MHSCPTELANRFSGFFSDKIIKIRSSLDSLAQHTDDTATPSVGPDHPSSETTAADDDSSDHCSIRFDEFEHTTESEVRKVIMASKSTTCQLDPLPTPLLKEIIDTLLPVIVTIINMSFDEAHVPDELKMALIIPLLKKLGLDLEILKNFRPVSNLPFISKILERIASSRILFHMSVNMLHEIFQSSYKKFHSTETALLKIQTDILTALDQKKCVLLIMLDLSAAFDTIDHPTLLSRLKSELGVCGRVYDWFHSYLTNRKQCVIIDKARSNSTDLEFGVPQGSVLGPILFIIYMGPLGKVLKPLGVNFHFYADDSQIYISFGIKDSQSAINRVESAIMVIKQWMLQNFLCLNEDKTEVLLIASKSDHDKLDIPHINIGNEKISPAKQARNIGFVFDALMNCQSQINHVCKTGWYQLRKIGKLRPYLDRKATESLVHSFITSRIDNNNSLYLGLPDYMIRRLQVLHNAAARLIMRLPKHNHITPTLQELHWLPVEQRIKFKTLLMVFKILHGMAPEYLADLIQQRPRTARSMRSDSKSLLVVPRSRTVTYGDRNFSNIAPKYWNNLPQEIRDCDTLSGFKRSLKTYLFREAFHGS